MQEFLNMWKNYVNFSDRTTVRGYWMAFLFNIIAAFVVGIIAGITGFRILSVLYSLAITIPSLAMQVRRLRDAGKRWTYLFIGLIPFAGIILLIIALCKPSIQDDGVPVV